MRKIKFVAIAQRWFDAKNGNTYHSVKVIKTSNSKTIGSGSTVYGYDDAYCQTALSLMAENKWLPVAYRGDNSYLFERENDYPILWIVNDGTKQEMLANVA